MYSTDIITNTIYTITRFLCAFSLVVGAKMASNPRQITSARLVSLFSCLENPSINHSNFYCVKEIHYIFPCAFTVIDHRRRHV